MIKKSVRVVLGVSLGFLFALMAGMMFATLQKPEHASILGYVWFIASVVIWWRLQPRRVTVAVDG